MAEGVRHLFTEGIEVTVTHVDALLVEGEIDVAFRLFRLLLFLVGLEVHAGTHGERRHLELIVEGKIGIRRRVAILHGKRHGQLTAGVHLTRQHVGNAVAHFLPGLESAYQGICQFFP